MAEMRCKYKRELKVKHAAGTLHGTLYGGSLGGTASAEGAEGECHGLCTYATLLEPCSLDVEAGDGGAAGKSVGFTMCRHDGGPFYDYMVRQKVSGG